MTDCGLYALHIGVRDEQHDEYCIKVNWQITCIWCWRLACEGYTDVIFSVSNEVLPFHSPLYHWIVSYISCILCRVEKPGDVLDQVFPLVFYFTTVSSLAALQTHSAQQTVFHVPQGRLTPTYITEEQQSTVWIQWKWVVCSSENLMKSEHVCIMIRTEGNDSYSLKEN